MDQMKLLEEEATRQGGIERGLVMRAELGEEGDEQARRVGLRVLLQRPDYVAGETGEGR